MARQIWETVRPAPMASMLDTTKLSMATVAALLNSCTSIDVSRMRFKSSMRRHATPGLDRSTPGIHSWRSIHKREIPPKVFQAVRATEERGEIG